MQGLLSQGVPQEKAPPTEQAPMGQEPSAPMEEKPSDKVSDEAAPILDKAVGAVYSEANFPKMVELFKTSGVEGFPQAMAVSIVGTLDRIEGDEKLSDQALAEVGGALFEMITEDMVSSGTLQGITPELVSKAAGETLNMWAQKNPDRFNKDEFVQAIQSEIQGSEQAASTGQPAQQPQGLLSGGM